LKIIIIGGVAAGASAAVKARRANEDAEIVVFEKGPYVSFANCGLPYYVGGDIAKKENLILVTPILFKERFNIDVRTKHEVVDINPREKTISVITDGSCSEEKYDKLIIATGGVPVIPQVSGTNLSRVYTVFTVDDATQIADELNGEIKSAAIIGGGFIGLETAEALAKKGIKTSLVEKMPQLIPNFDPEFSLPVERHLREMGVNVILGKSIKAIRGDTHAKEVELDDGTALPTNMVILAMGVRPRLELARKAGLEIGPTNGIVVDETMLTSDPHIYAAGDIVESVHMVSGEKVRIPLAGSANKQGRVAGANSVGGKMVFKGVLGTSVIKVGQLTVACTGLSEKQAHERNLKYTCAYSPSYSHATYYPGARRIILKIIFEENTGRILGAQGVGWQGVDKRIDVLATAIYAGLTVYDLENLDLAYAPPYSSAKDPAILGGMIAGNILRREVRNVLPRQLDEMRRRDSILLVDCRDREDVKKGSIEGNLSLPLDELRKRYKELDKSKKIVLYCGVGYRSYVAYRFLKQKGYDVYNLTGGYTTYVMSMDEGPNIKK
jgi:NADPH-dependent 2,4-dienoyl-CoA reductase/sulfur reductase-like enzyme/rhodanese-related sulfurtransferase